MKKKGAALREKREKSSGRIIAGWISMILVIALVIFLRMYLWNQRIVMPDQAMTPEITQGDLLLSDSLRYQFFSPKRFDVIIFRSQYDSSRTFVRRIIALPGETIQIMNGNVYINGVVLQVPWFRAAVEEAGRAFSQITLGQDEYFVMGDNHSALSDSREVTIGSVRREAIEGRIWMKIWPLEHFGKV